MARPLFVVDSAGYRLTAFGEEAARRAAAHGRSCAIAADAPRRGTLRRPIRLTTARPRIGYLLPRLLDFAKAHLEFELTVLADARVLSLARREADIAVRLGRPEDSDLVGSHVADIDTPISVRPTWPSARWRETGSPLSTTSWATAAAKPGGSPNIARGRASRCAATTSCCKPTPFAAASASGCCRSTSRAELVRLPGARRRRGARSGSCLAAGSRRRPTDTPASRRAGAVVSSRS